MHTTTTSCFIILIPEFEWTKREKMVENLVSVVVGISVMLVISIVWKAFCWVWLTPKKLEKFMRAQGIDGPSYKFLHGNIKELVALTKEAKSKPMELSHRITSRVMPYIQQTVQKYGKLSFIWIGPVPRVIVTDTEMIRDILSNKSGHFGKIKSQPTARLVITGLVSYEAEKWAKHRRILNPTFHLEKLKLMMPAFYTVCHEMVNKWKKLVLEQSCELDVQPDLQRLTADVISRTAFGSSYEQGRRVFQLQTEQAELSMQAAQSAYIPGSRFLPTKRNKRMNEIYKEVRSLIRDMVKKRENGIQTEETMNADLLGLLMESNLKDIQDNKKSKNVGMSIDDVIEECKMFYLAGQETTASFLAWTMILLSMHADWQEKAREEVFHVFGKNAPDFEGLSRLKIVTMILNEVLRLYPPASLLTRATYKHIKVGNVIFPPNVEIAMPALLVHRDKGIWGEDAEEFKPERFAEGVSKATKNHLSFFPFGWGPRICIGQMFSLLETKMAISMILQSLSFELSSNYVHDPRVMVTLQPEHGTHLILHKI